MRLSFFSMFWWRRLGCLLLLAGGTSGLAAGQYLARPRLPARALRCTLEAVAPEYLAYEPIILRVRILNRADSALTLVSALHGSESGKRSPRAAFYVSVVSLLGPRPEPPAYSGHLHGIGPDDFVTLAPGQSFNPLERMTRFPFALPSVYPVLPPGTYDITFRYSTLEQDAAEWGELYPPTKTPNSLAATGAAGAGLPEPLLPLLRRVPRVALSSNTVRVVVRPQPNGNLARP
ncbi:hypothetical protein [Hymenobacter sp. B81]|uniref:hypothetical protein n=1 Tax=Hymenobacter sp. B81 TaxID=3344878 RepID=UPI0037DD8203